MARERLVAELGHHVYRPADAAEVVPLVALVAADHRLRGIVHLPTDAVELLVLGGARGRGRRRGGALVLKVCLVDGELGLARLYDLITDDRRSDEIAMRAAGAATAATAAGRVARDARRRCRRCRWLVYHHHGSGIAR